MMFFFTIIIRTALSNDITYYNIILLIVKEIKIGVCCILGLKSVLAKTGNKAQERRRPKENCKEVKIKIKIEIKYYTVESISIWD